MNNIKSLIVSAVLMEQSGQDNSGLISVMASMPNTENWDGTGAAPSYGEPLIRKLIAEGREKALEAIEAEKKNAKKRALLAKQEAFKTEVSEIDIFDTDDETLADLVSQANELKAFLVVTVNDNGDVGLTVSGLRKPKGGSKGGGKPKADQPRPYKAADTGERILGSLTTWAKENVPADVLKAAKHTEAGKLRGGNVLVTFLKNEQEVDGSKFGPYIVVDEDSEAFKADFAAWESKSKDSEDSKAEE